MKIKKLGHCCFIAEPKTGVRIMTDPGAFSALQLQEKNPSLYFQYKQFLNLLEQYPDTQKLVIKTIKSVRDFYETMEKTKKYHGRYFILGGTVSKLKKEDIEKLKETGAEGCIIGKALYEGKIKLEEIS